MKLIRIFLFGLIVLNLTACWPIAGQHGLIHNRENDYLKSQQQTTLAIPAGLSNSNIQDQAPIPQGPAWSSTTPASILPPGSILAQGKAIAPALQGNGPWLGVGSNGEPALLVNGKIATVWPQVATALQALQYQIAGSDQRVGLYMVSRNKQAFVFNVLQAQQGVVITVESYESIPLQNKDAKKLLQELSKKL